MHRHTYTELKARDTVQTHPTRMKEQKKKKILFEFILFSLFLWLMIQSLQYQIYFVTIRRKKNFFLLKKSIFKHKHQNSTHFLNFPTGNAHSFRLNDKRINFSSFFLASFALLQLHYLK